MGDLIVKSIKNQAELIIFMLYAIVSIKASIYDIKYRLVKNKTYISLIFLSVTNALRIMSEKEEISWVIYFILVMSVAVGIAIFAIITDAMGGGDVKYITCSIFYLMQGKGTDIFILWFGLIFILMFFYQAFEKFILKQGKIKKGIPMVPFISAAGIITVIISDFIIKL